MNELRKDAFNSTWHAAPGAQLNFRTMTIDFNFSVDKGDRQRLPLTLDRWESRELQQQYRIFPFRAPSTEPGNHTLNIQFTRNDAMDVPVTVALDSIRFKPLSSNSGSDDKSSTQSQADSGTAPTQDDTGTVPTQDPAASPTDTGSATPASSQSGDTSGQSGRTINIAKIVAPVVAIILLLLLLIGILLCWRRRQIKKHRRLKASIRAFQPVPFDPYPHKHPYPFYQPQDTEVEKPAPIVPAYSQRGSRPTSLLIHDGAVFEPLPRFSTSGDSLYPNRHPLRNSADSTSQPSFVSYEQQWRLAASQKRPVSTVADGKSPTEPTPAYPHFVVVNR
ncbi:hypothetical protein H1R20_g8337, partial [Candolleomyces eurysporus]